MKYLLFSSLLSLLLSRVDSKGCKGGMTPYQDPDAVDADGCNLNSLTCDENSCKHMRGEWTEECPDPDPNCDPLAPSDDDPPCTGPPVHIDRYGQKMYRRKVIANDTPQDSEDGGTICRITLGLCEGETMMTHGVDIGFGDVHTLGGTPEWWDYTGTEDYKYDGMSGRDGSAYNAVNPMNENAVQFIIKKRGPYPEEYGCTAGVDCKFGNSELACMAPVGSELLMGAVPLQDLKDESNHLVQKPNFSREPGSGPYTINMIAMGIGFTELLISAYSELLEPFASDGGFSTIKEVNFLWCNSYLKNAAWAVEPTDSTDLTTELIREGLKYGIRINIMHSISREERPEADFPRTDVSVIGEAFKLTNTTNQDPNIKWHVVGKGNFKRSIYPQIEAWGFDLPTCWPEANVYPKCGAASLYSMDGPGGAEGLRNRERSQLWKYYENLALKSKGVAESEQTGEVYRISEPGEVGMGGLRKGSFAIE